jgi:hypothetical protein
MRTIPIKVWNRIEMLRAPIAAEVPVDKLNKRRWIAIHCSINGRTPELCPPHLYCVVDTEFDVALLAINSPSGDEDSAITGQKEYYLDDIRQLYELLESLNIDPASFDAPWHVNHPLL